MSIRRPLPIAVRIVLAVAILLGAGWLLFWPQARAHLQAVAILWQLDGRPVPGLLRPLTSDPITVRTLTVSTTEGPMQAMLYAPARHPNAPGLVITHGISHQGTRDPRMIAFARSIAACGLRVLTPDLPDLGDYHVSTVSIDKIGGAAAWLAQKTGHPVGLMGLSFSGGLALMAAAQPQYASNISFVFAVGAHDSMNRVANFYVTGQDALPNGTTEKVVPNEYGLLVLEYAHLEDFTQPEDTEAIRAALRARLYEDPTLEQSLVGKFTATQKIEYNRIVDPRQQASAIAKSSQKHAAELAAVSPHGHLYGLRAPVFLLHGREDNIIPYGESEWLARDLPPGTLQALLVSPLVSHVDTEKGKKAGWIDEWRLVHFMARVMEHAERTSASN
ncbi:MAG TPA: alpha/beta fold hydrolase [Acidobacteriaceae bacterium]|nr:alpha/beta fold hydrolase [Acidobacteriaceae bacterium]